MPLEKAKEKVEKDNNVMDAGHMGTFDEIVQTKKEEEKGDRWDGKAQAKVGTVIKVEDKVKDRYMDHVGIVEGHIMQRNAQKVREKGLVKRAK